MHSKSDFRAEKRADAVKSVQRGEEPKVVSRVMDIPLNTLYDWLSRYRSGDWHALRDGSRSDRPKKVGGAVLKWLYDAITTGDPRQYQFEFRLWNRRIIKSMLKKIYGIELSLSSISWLLNQLGLSAQRPVYKAYQQDRLAVKQWLEETYPGLFARAKKLKATIYFADEASFRSDSHLFAGIESGRAGLEPSQAKDRKNGHRKQKSNEANRI